MGPIAVTIRTTGATWVVETGGNDGADAVDAVWKAITDGDPLSASFAPRGAIPHSEGARAVVINPTQVIHVSAPEGPPRGR